MEQSSAASSSQRFAALHGQKRTSLDASAAARRTSFAEQAQPLGFLGGLWNSYVFLCFFIFFLEGRGGEIDGAFFFGFNGEGGGGLA